ncbi:50S ribosomal protein L11 methyltransferase [Streptomyces sp. NBC_01334]|uniref:50S ribosomal protein L11 methyltransferase n=1 Tax=Streptomyces sp. NBC_01334 TaxID=2903827 RepID=UPI003FA3CA99
MADTPLPTTARRDPAAAVAFDLGAGTGVLAAVPARRGVGRVVGTDLGPRAVDWARDSARRLGLDGRIAVAPGLYPGGGAASGRADLAVCDPPWLPGPADRRPGTGGVRRGQQDAGRVPGGSRATPAAGRRGPADPVRSGRTPRSAHPRGAAPARRNRRSAGCGSYRCTAPAQAFAGCVRPPVRGPRRGNHLPLSPHHRPTGRTTAPSWARMSPCLPCC